MGMRPSFTDDDVRDIIRAFRKVAIAYRQRVYAGV